MQLNDSNAKEVWDYFRQLSDIPRPSKKEDKVCDWLETLAEKKGLPCRKDAVGNIVIEVPPTDGYENAPGLIIQGHTDMVCEKTPDSEHNFDNDPIQWVEKDGWLYGNNTTLGSDNGIGVCMALALLEQSDLPHPKLELLFTVDEETGLTGADSLEEGFVKGQRLINLDSEDEGYFTIGCAGGIQTDMELDLTFIDAAADKQFVKLEVSDLTGGHSGVNIHENRANAILVLTVCLHQLSEAFEINLCSIEGGNAHNAIPRDAHAILAINQNDFEKIANPLLNFANYFSEGYKQTDPNLSLSLTKVDEQSSYMDLDTTQNAILLLGSLPHGPVVFAKDMAGLVETSSNLAQVKTSGKLLEVMTSQRSFEPSQLEKLTTKIHDIAAKYTARYVDSNGYPSWSPKWESEILETCKSLYKETAAKEPVVEVIHAGLECGIIDDKCPQDLDMISFGPTIENPHSPQERVNIETVDKVWDFLCKLIPLLK